MKQGTLLSNVKTYVIGGLVMSCFPALMLSLQILFRVKVNAAYPTTDFPQIHPGWRSSAVIHSVQVAE